MEREATFGMPMRAAACLLAAVVVMATMLASAGNALAQTERAKAFAVPVSGKLSDGGTFRGKIVNPEVKARKAGKLVMTGTLRGKARTDSGQVRNVNKEFRTPVKVKESGETFRASARQASCPILNLDLGPINLDLLGLQVDLSAISLDVTAVPGAGNLLGNLLCAITGLLDNAGNPTNAIANLLDRVFSLLG